MLSLPGGLSLEQVFLFTKLCSVLKDDILLVQPSRIPANEAPSVLSPLLLGFLGNAVGVPQTSAAEAWKHLKDDIWTMSRSVLSKEEKELFRMHGSKVGLTWLTLYPPSHHCTHAICNRLAPLKKAIPRQVVVYTLSDGVVPAWEVQLYCEICKTSYFPDFAVHQNVRTYYPDTTADCIQIGAHQFVERRLTGLWTSSMLNGWMSASNCSRSYDMALSQRDECDFAAGGWQFGCVLTTNHVWDAFIIVTLLDYHLRNDTCLQVSHDGMQKDRFTAAMQARNDEVIMHGQDVVSHCCDKCLRLWTDPETGATREVQAVVTDGLSMGHTRCQVPHCITPLESNRHRFCSVHAPLGALCSIVGCNRPARDGYKSCDDQEHIDMERLHCERGQAFFTLRERLQRHRQTHPDSEQDEEDTYDEDSEDIDGEDIEWFEFGEQGDIRIRSGRNPGSIGVVDADTEPCAASKSSTGNRKYKALFGRCRTHNEQLLVWPCGVIFARATFYNAEAVSNVLLFVEKAFSVQGAHKPEHLVYDSNCNAKQQVLAHEDHWSFFRDIGMTVDVFHFLHKHKVGHEFCQRYCNPAMYPELLGPDGKHWWFNTSIAEQMNAWLGGYHSMCREMLSVKYNFFLDEMIRLRNLCTLANLDAAGHNPRERA
ncbi:hypothetical protein GGX14DRAFT_579985 [Mycena pura]|uniref:CxC5 like cysteine cluster associated with KDZ domain-containing protein n=1 Tax=Mycena pura TaxID=153505 RepID=A0AAD6UNH4_9AGAR|nr:hypothetical protein GGX14DRAFT_579985 [Mycena pura]